MSYDIYASNPTYITPSAKDMTSYETHDVNPNNMNIMHKNHLIPNNAFFNKYQPLFFP